MKYVADISSANLVTNRTINVLRFEGDLIQTSEIQEESYFTSLSIVSLNFKTNCPTVPSSPYGMSCMYTVPVMVTFHLTKFSIFAGSDLEVWMTSCFYSEFQAKIN